MEILYGKYGGITTFVCSVVLYGVLCVVCVMLSVCWLCVKKQRDDNKRTQGLSLVNALLHKCDVMVGVT